MSKSLYVIFFLFCVTASAQTALYNQGNIRIHDGGNLGFHTDLINDSPFDQNQGLVGFYGPQNLRVLGTMVPVFYDLETATQNGLVLGVGMDNTNNTNFISGNILTPKDNAAVTYNFLENAFYTGDGNTTKITGYAAVSNQREFIFPVGDAEQLRPLVLTSESANPLAKCAYFFEDPNNPSSFAGNFDTNAVDLDVELISTTEFWRLEGNIPSTITLSWTPRSALGAITIDPTDIIPVGWSKTTNKWENLGIGQTMGTLEQGFVTSNTFIPDQFEIIALGSSGIALEPLENIALSLGEYYVSPNGDGINDTFHIPEMERSPINEVKIYDRFGLQVFQKSNYTNEFNGVANVDHPVISREKGLPSGIYFYTVYLADLNVNYQGFLYLAR